MNFFSMHLYGAEPQLLQMKATEEEKAIEELKDIMKDVDFDEEDDDVVLFRMNDSRDGVPVFNYWNDYLQEVREEERENGEVA